MTTLVRSSTTLLADLFGKIDFLLLFFTKEQEKNQFWQTNVLAKLLKNYTSSVFLIRLQIFRNGLTDLAEILQSFILFEFL